MGEPQVPTTFERSAPAGSNSLAIPESEVGLPECEIPLELSCERAKGARLPAQPSGVVRKLIPPAGGGFQRKPLVHQNKKGTPAGAIFLFWWT